jgi:O-antigen/teichoic acid export membrane protein
MSKPLGLADRAGFMVLGNTAQAVAQLATLMVLARLFSRAEVGCYRQVWLVFNTLTPVLLLGVPYSILYFMPRLDAEARRQFALRTVTLLLVLGAAFALVMGAGAPFIARLMKNPALVPLLRTFALYALFALPTAVLSNLLVADGRHRAAGAVIGGFAFTLTAAVIVAAAVTHQVIWAVRATTLAALVQWIVTAVLITRAYGWRVSLDWGALKRQLGWSVPVGLSAVIAVLSQRAGSWIVAVLFKDSATYAIYDYGAVEVPLVGVLTFSVTTTLLPVFSGMHHRDEIAALVRLWHESMRKVALILFPIFVMLMICAEPIMLILFTRKYIASAPIFRVYLLLLPLRTASYSAVLQSAGRTQELWRGTLGSLIAVAVVGTLLAHTIGMIGPAVALVLASYAVALYWLLRTRRALRISFAETFPWVKVGRIFGLSLLLGGLVAPLLWLRLSPWATIGVIAPLYSALYLAAILKTGLLTPGDRELARRWLSLSVLRKPVEEAAADLAPEPDNPVAEPRP